MRQLYGLTDPRAAILNWACSWQCCWHWQAEANIGKYLGSAWCSEAVSVVLIVHLAQFGKQHTRGMWNKILCAVKSWIVNAAGWRLVILFLGGVWYLLSITFGIKTKHPAVLHIVLQDQVLAGPHSKLFGKHRPWWSCCQELQDFTFWGLPTSLLPGCLNIKNTLQQ